MRKVTVYLFCILMLTLTVFVTVCAQSENYDPIIEWDIRDA